MKEAVKEEFQMDKILKNFFDFQRFQGNDHMKTLISETESRYGEAPQVLSDEELDFVNAAGEAPPMHGKTSMDAEEDKGQKPHSFEK